MDDPAATLEEWVRVLQPAGQLVLIEGRWATGAGMTAEEVVPLLRAAGRTARVTRLDDARLWGRAIDDERYVIISHAASGSAPGDG
jgi:hypothetical protein